MYIVKQVGSGSGGSGSGSGKSDLIRIHNTGINIDFAPKENVTQAPNERPPYPLQKRGELCFISKRKS
jgi:hypothetical protein